MMTTTDRTAELPIDSHFLDLSETYLYMVNFGLGTFFGNRKKYLHRFTMKENQKNK